MTQSTVQLPLHTFLTSELLSRFQVRILVIKQRVEPIFGGVQITRQQLPKSHLHHPTPCRQQRIYSSEA